MSLPWEMHLQVSSFGLQQQASLHNGLYGITTQLGVLDIYLYTVVLHIYVYTCIQCFGRLLVLK